MHLLSFVFCFNIIITLITFAINCDNLKKELVSLSQQNLFVKEEYDMTKKKFKNVVK